MLAVIYLRGVYWVMKKSQMSTPMFCKTCQMVITSLLAGLTMPGHKVWFAFFKKNEMSIVTVLSLTDCLFGIYSTLLYNILISSFYLLLNAHHKYLLVEWLLRDKHKWTALRRNVQCTSHLFFFFSNLLEIIIDIPITLTND